MFISHTIGVVTHGAVGSFGATKMVKEGLVNPVYKIVTAHVAKFIIFYAFYSLYYLIQCLIPCCLSKTAVFFYKWRF